MNCGQQNTLCFGMFTSAFYALAVLLSPALAQVSTNEVTSSGKTEVEILEETETQKCLEREITIGMKGTDFTATGLIGDLANDSAFYCSQHGFFHYDKLKEQARQMIITKCLDREITIGMTKPDFGSIGSIGDLTYDAAYRCSQHGAFYNEKLTGQAYQTIYSRLTPSQKTFVDKMRDHVWRQRRPRSDLTDLANDSVLYHA